MNVEPIGRIETCYPQKFGVPRQPGIVSGAWGRVVFESAYRGENFIRGIEEFSHVWLIFQFHLAEPKAGRGTVRPPRLGGDERVGVFATRAPYRPNNMGLSVVELVGVDYDSPDGPVLEVRGADIVDGTPILDVKPYVEFCDSVEGTRSGFVSGAPDKLEVLWEAANIPVDSVRELIEETVGADPRPAYHDDPKREYGMRLAGYEVKWRVDVKTARIFSCESSMDN